ncbi:MAG: hypothetical protein KA354_05520 [Phycisphaerae bacterium]|nr:hypothetical protein [Phycisphaerae bacterium]
MPSASSPVRRLCQRVLALLEASDPHPFLSIVEDYLWAVPADGAVRAPAVRLRVGKGLVSVAAELARACPASSLEAVELEQAAEDLAGVSSDLISPAEAESLLASNLEVFRSPSRH